VSAAINSFIRLQEPELLATAPNEVWNWDITTLLGPAKWTYFYLSLDLFGRYVPGWMVTHWGGAELAKQLIEETIGKHPVPPAQDTAEGSQ